MIWDRWVSIDWWSFPNTDDVVWFEISKIFKMFFQKFGLTLFCHFSVYSLNWSKNSDPDVWHQIFLDRSWRVCIRRFKIFGPDGGLRVQNFIDQANLHLLNWFDAIWCFCLDGDLTNISLVIEERLLKVSYYKTPLARWEYPQIIDQNNIK